VFLFIHNYNFNIYLRFFGLFPSLFFFEIQPFGFVWFRQFVDKKESWGGLGFRLVVLVCGFKAVLFVGFLSVLFLLRFLNNGKRRRREMEKQ
jgi:hypothetical protein